MFRSLRSLFRTHRIRLISMSMIFAMVVLIITLLEQIIINIDTQINNETKPIVGADLTIDSSSGFSNQLFWELQILIASNGWQVLRSIEFYTTIDGVKEPKLVQVQWVENGYPWYWDLIIRSLDGTTTRNSKEKSLQDGVWIDQQTYALIWQTGSIKVWSLTLPVQWIISQQASLWFSFLDEGRTIIMPYALASQTNLTDFGSRIDHELQVKIENDTQALALEQQIEEIYGDQLRTRLARDRVEQLWGIVQQLDQYTSTLLIVTLLLSLMVMATATMTMTINIKTSVAIMRIVWLTRPQTILMTTLLLWSLFLFGWLMWWSLAYFVFKYIGTVLPLAKDFVRYPSQLVIIALLSLISFWISCRQSIRYLSMTHPLTLLKQEWATPTNWTLLWWWVLAWWSWIILSILNRNLLFSAGVIIITALILRWWYYFLMKWFRFLHTRFWAVRFSSFLWFDASRQSIIPGNQTWLLVGWLSSALIAFCIIIAISLSFMERLNISAVNQPNLFVLNVRTEDIITIKKIDPQNRLYDTILWRIWSINNVNLKDYLKQNNLEWGEFSREFNMTSRLLENSPMVKGEELSSGGVSFDQDFAKRLWVKLWDNINLLIQGRNFDLTVTSLRKSVRTWAEPFFYIQLDSAQFTQAPRSRFWVTRQPESDLILFKKSALESVWTHLSFIDISAIITLVSDISNKIITIILTCISIIVVLILLVSIASNEASALVAKKTYRLYHIIGMTKSQLSQISRRVGLLYVAAIMGILAVTVPATLRFIYRQATILTRSWVSMIPLSVGIVITLWVMVIS